MKYDIVAAVKLDGHQGVKFVGLIDVSPQYWDLYWSCHESHCRYAKSKVEILNTYDVCNYEYENEVAFIKQYPPTPQEPSARLGFIAPDGRWFPCSYTAHRALAYKLSLLYVSEDSYPEVETLRTAGWVALHSSAHIDSKRDKITPEQEHTLSKIVEAFEIEEAKNPDIDWGTELLKNPEDYAEQNWWTAPDADLEMPTYAQSLRESFEWLRGNRKIAPKTIVAPCRAGRRIEMTGD